MFCDGDGNCDPHWCALCKIPGCPACCGCTECQRLSQGYYSGGNTSHGGYPVTYEWSDIP
jgi:hypothetical protein